jgi:streptogramin lyase
MEHTLDLAALKVSGLAVDGNVVWLASIRERLVARAPAEGDDPPTVVVAYPYPVADVAPSPDGLWLVAGGGSQGRQCVLWSLAERREVLRFDCPGGAGGGLAFHRDRLWLTHRHDRRLYVLDPASGEVERVLATEHEIFSPSVAGGDLWLVECETGPFGRFSPKAESTYAFSHFDPEAGRAIERRVAPGVPAAMATDGARFWWAPRDGTGVASTARRDLAPA